MQTLKTKKERRAPQPNIFGEGVHPRASQSLVTLSPPQHAIPLHNSVMCKHKLKEKETACQPADTITQDTHCLDKSTAGQPFKFPHNKDVDFGKKQAQHLYAAT